MTILEMFQREDIYSIIEQTLPQYYQRVDGKKGITVKIHPGNSWNKKLLIYPRLGIIVPKNSSRAVKKEVYAWFDVQNNLIKKIIAWSYITLCFLTNGIMADASVELSDESVIHKDLLIIPSNRKIRIYNYKEDYVDSIVKAGFNNYYLKNEIAMRRQLKYPFIVKVDKSGDDWYREQLLRGKGLVRVEPKRYKQLIVESLNDLKTIYNDNQKSVKLFDYANALVKKNKNTFQCVLSKKTINCEKQIYKLLDDCTDIVSQSKSDIVLVLAHGDLQTGNIHLDEVNNKLYLIDWETGGEKSLWYDAATVLCTTRRQNGFSNMINNRNDDSIKNNILYFDEEKERNMDEVAAVLLLEELSFFLEEMSDFPGNIGAEVIDRLIYELNRIDWNTFSALR